MAISALAPSWSACEAPLTVRPIAARDSDRLAAAFERLSPQSRYRRYFSPKRVLTGKELARLTAIDHLAHEALVAIDTESDRIVGVARYAAPAAGDGRTAHFAVELDDDWHGCGLAQRLSREVIALAAANGYACLKATTLAENQPARRLLRRLGFRTRKVDGFVLELERPLSPCGCT